LFNHKKKAKHLLNILQTRKIY